MPLKPDGRDVPPPPPSLPLSDRCIVNTPVVCSPVLWMLLFATKMDIFVVYSMT